MELKIDLQKARERGLPFNNQYAVLQRQSWHRPCYRISNAYSAGNEAEEIGVTIENFRQKEKRKMKRSALIAITVVCLFSVLGCPKKMEVASAPGSREEAAAVPTQAAPAAAPEARPGEPEERAAGPGTGLKLIYFDFDKYFIRDDARPVMQANAEWLKAHPKVNVRIEGTCDERGTIEYNLALGQRRAASAKKYLIDTGIPSSRISLISYGKEKPVCADHSETCWQKNRRDDFVEAKE
jgi:peptidoglycan-associated lipoprotein